MTHPLSSSTESEALRIGDPFGLDSRFHGNDTPFVILNRKRSASDWGSRDYRLDSRFHGNDTFFVILNRKRSASDWGSSWIWIPAFAGMTRLESFASNGNDTPFVILNRKRSASDWGSIPSRHPRLIIPPVIPYLMRDPFGLDSRFHGNVKKNAGMTHPLSSSTESPLVILNRKQSASDWGSSWIWIPVFTGMTREGCGNDKGRYGNDKRNENNDG